MRRKSEEGRLKIGKMHETGGQEGERGARPSKRTFRATDKRAGRGYARHHKRTAEGHLTEKHGGVEAAGGNMCGDRRKIITPSFPMGVKR